MLFQVVNPLTELMRTHDWIFPAGECVHIALFAPAVGTIAATDLSLLGIGFPRKSAPQLVRGTEIWAMSALVIIIFSGFLLFSIDPDLYYLNRAFQFKMTCLVLAIVFNYTIHRKVAVAVDGSPGVAKLVAVVSLLLWTGVIFGGLFIAFQ
jgi:hypothetical protein